MDCCGRRQLQIDHLHHFIAIVVDDLHCDLVCLWFRERALDYSTTLPQKHVAHKKICGSRSSAECDDLACIQKRIEDDRKAVSKDCGGKGVPRQVKTKTACKPTAKVEARTEGGRNPAHYEVVVISNDCPVGVSFPYSITTHASRQTTQHFTQCGPAKTARFVALGSRTSSTADQKLAITGAPKECKSK